MGLKKSLEGHFSAISDARCACDVEIPLMDILFVLMFGVLAGYDNTEDIKSHADYFRDDLRQRFGVTRIPSESTLRRVLRVIRPEELGKATLQLMQEAFSHLEGDVIAVDGKAIRGSTVRGKLASQLRILSAYDTQLQMTIGSVEVGEKTNEIPGMLDVLQLFNFSGRIITADAMHCQKDTCRAIVSGDGDYVFQVKRNQKDLYEGVKDSMDHLIAEPEEGLQVQR